MKFKLSKVLFLCLFALSLYSCTKEVPPELLSSNKQKAPEKQQMPDDSIHRNLVPKDHVHSEGENSGNKSGDKSGEDLNYKVDQAAMRYTKEADDADAKFRKSKSEADKNFCIEKQLAAANYLMFEADMNPKDKYKPALIRYRRVLELDPNNQEAMVNKSQIEDIYKSMGKPIPN